MTSKNIGEETRKYILRQLLTSKSLREIEDMFSFSIKGLKWHITQIYKSEGVSNRIELLAKYVKLPSEVDCVLYDFYTAKKPKNMSTVLPIGNTNA
jgi:DNA-binding CsgD family transcriptional regulator